MDGNIVSISSTSLDILHELFSVYLGLRPLHQHVDAILHHWGHGAADDDREEHCAQWVSDCPIFVVKDASTSNDYTYAHNHVAQSVNECCVRSATSSVLPHEIRRSTPMATNPATVGDGIDAPTATCARNERSA